MCANQFLANPLLVIHLNCASANNQKYWKISPQMRITFRPEISFVTLNARVGQKHRKVAILEREVSHLPGGENWLSAQFSLLDERELDCKRPIQVGLLEAH